MSRQRSSRAVSAHGRHVSVDIVLFVLITCCLVGLKLLLEEFSPGKVLDGAVYALLQTRLKSGQDLPVAVVDISALDAERKPGKLSPRDQLTKLIDSIQKDHPDAIGIDVDFS